MTDQPPDRWACYDLHCDEAGDGDAKAVERAAEAHTRKFAHATCTFHKGRRR